MTSLDILLFNLMVIRPVSAQWSGQAWQKKKEKSYMLARLKIKT